MSGNKRRYDPTVSSPQRLRPQRQRTKRIPFQITPVLPASKTASNKKKPSPKKPPVVAKKTKKDAPAVALTLDKLMVNPKTIRDRKRNAKILKEFSTNHSDDVFGGGNKEDRKVRIYIAVIACKRILGNIFFSVHANVLRQG